MANAEAETADSPAPAWTELPNGRIAELIVSRSHDEGTRGSGCLIAPGLVLTCSHVVEGASGIRVRFNADRGPQEREFEASTAWHHSGIDVAVLTIGSEEQQRVRPDSFARIGERTVQLPCEAKGLPLFKLRRPETGSQFRNVEHMHATCAPHANARDRTLELRVSAPPDPNADPRDPDERDGAYEPWAGMSGAVVFSSGRIIGVVTRHHAAEGGRLTASRVDSWKDLVAPGELGRLETLLGCGSLAPGDLPTVLPADDGTGTATGSGSGSSTGPQLPKDVRTHEQELAKRSNKAKYLTGSQIPFVSPGSGHPADPGRLLTRLSALSAPDARYDSLGVVLVGAAGSGKTRTCFEVAARAERNGWTVLHVGPNARGLDAERLAATVSTGLAREQDVLLVFDYLDSYAELDLDEFRNEVEERRSSAAKFACIASIRPGARQRAHERGQLRFFEEVRVCQEESHQGAIVDQIVLHVARKAVKDHGASEVAAFCGRRPVLALLIARAIESQIPHRGHDVLRQPGLRSDGDLSYWLRRRTDEDFAGRRTDLIASAVAAASCAQGRDALEAAVDSFLACADDPAFTAGGVGVVGHLIDLGWLVSSDDELDVMHDFVADELLQQALLPNSRRLEGDAAEQMFSAFLSSTRTFRLAANHVRRWSLDLDRTKQEDVRRVCDNWLAGVGDGSLRHCLSEEADPAEIGRTLLTLLSGPPWQSGVIAAWDALVQPWLEQVEEEAPYLAQRLFANAVRNTSEAVPEHLAASALDWQRKNRERQSETRAIPEALLRAEGVTAEHRSEAAREAVAWLRSHGLAWGCRPLTRALLARDDLPSDLAEKAVGTGLQLAESYPWMPATAHVLNALLDRRDLQPGQADQAFALGLGWLGRHSGTSVASFVLPGLLGCENVPEERALEVLDRALDWLHGRSTSPLASFVLRRLIAHPCLRGERAERATALSLEWLGEHGTEPNASFVLQPLLRLYRPGKERADDIVRHVFGWLEENCTREDACFVLRRVLANRDLPEWAAESAAEKALLWLTAGSNGTRRDAKSILGRLLAYRRFPVRHEHCAAAVRWLDLRSNLGSEEASDVLSPLLRHPALGDLTGTAVDHAVVWLDEHPASDRLPYVLGPMLALDEFTTGASADRATDLALNWLDGHRTSEGAHFVLKPLLQRRCDPGAMRTAVISRPPSTSTGPEQDDRFTALTVDLALDWLDVHHASGEAQRVMLTLLHIPLSEWDRRSRVVRRVLECADDDHVYLRRRHLYILSKQGPLPVEQGSALAGHIAERVRVRTSKSALDLLTSALWRQDAGTGEAAALVELAVQRLAPEQRLNSHGGKLLRVLLHRTDLDDAQTRAVTGRAREWLRSPQGQIPFASVLLGLLLRHRRLGTDGADGADGTEFVGAAFTWLGTHSSHPYALNVLSALLERPGRLTSEQADLCTRQAADWLSTADTTDAPAARHLAELLAERRAQRPDGHR